MTGNEWNEAVAGRLDPADVDRPIAAEIARGLVEVGQCRFATFDYADGARLLALAGAFAARAAGPVNAKHANAAEALTLKVKRWPSGKLPTRATDGSAGWDLHACERLEVVGRAEVATGIAVEIPPGHVGLVRGRSGLARRGVRVFEGTIDSDYRGELRVLMTRMAATPNAHGVLVNRGEPIVIEPGDRIAQLVIVPVPEIEIVEVDELSATERGDNGFGSSGR